MFVPLEFTYRIHAAGTGAGDRRSSFNLDLVRTLECIYVFLNISMWCLSVVLIFSWYIIWELLQVALISCCISRKGNKLMVILNEIYWNIGSPSVFCHSKLSPWGSAVVEWGRRISYSVFSCFVNNCGREVFSGILPRKLYLSREHSYGSCLMLTLWARVVHVFKIDIHADIYHNIFYWLSILVFTVWWTKPCVKYSVLIWCDNRNLSLTFCHSTTCRQSAKHATLLQQTSEQEVTSESYQIMIDSVCWSSKYSEIADSVIGPLNSWFIGFALLFMYSSFQVFWPCSWFAYQLSLTVVLLGHQNTKVNLQFRNLYGFTVQVLTGDGSFPTLYVSAVNGYRIVPPHFAVTHLHNTVQHLWQAPGLCTRVHTHTNQQQQSIETWRFSSCAL